MFLNSTSSRGLLVAASIVLITTGVESAFAGPSASLEQVRNGLATATTTPTPTWGTGNAGASNSHYLESHSIAYRTVMDQLPTDGTVIELVLGYNVKRSGSYAIDYLSHYQRLLPHVLFDHRDPEVFDPLAGISGIGPTVSTAAIPITTANLTVDPDGADPDPAAPQPSTSMASLQAGERQMTLFGGTLLDVTYVSEGDVSLSTSSSETQVRVRFTADGPRAVLAWGGHIACRWDWGFNSDGSPRSAGGISGSSYHMRLVGWNLGSLGNQDRSMSTDAVYPVPRCGISNLGPFCAGSANTHTAPAGMESYSWSLFDNTSGASIVGSTTGLSVLVQSGAGGSYGVMVTTGASGFTRSCQATVMVNSPATADAGPDQAVCAGSPQVMLSGAVGGGATSGTWGGGTGTFNPGASALNAIYTPSAAEITAGVVTLTLTTNDPVGPCPAAADAMRIAIQRAATVNAGADQIVCAGSPSVLLAGAIGGGATRGAWSGGAGTFSPDATTLTATYTPTAEEIAAGHVSLTLTTNDPDGPCAASSDVMAITIKPTATASAGPDQTVCASSPQVPLAGAIGGGASSGTWSGGTGTFSPVATALNATYVPTAAEVAAGGVTLTLTSNDPSGPCPAASDAVHVTILPAAVVYAGTDQAVCASNPQVQLSGVIGGAAASGTWSGGGGTFSPGATTPNAIYMPSAGEVAAGTVTLTLTTDDPPGPCPAIGDQMTILIHPAATVSAGADQVVCASSPATQLLGWVGGAGSTGTWNGGGGAFSPNRAALNAIYTPSAAEIAAGGVMLTLVTNDPAGPCPAVSDQVHIAITPAATANAGLDQTVCASSPAVNLAGSVGGAATTGTWSGGAGTFSPSASALIATYTPSAGEIAAGGVILTLTSNDPAGPCPGVSDQVAVTINRAATASAGADRTVCSSNPQVQLAGSVGGGATSGTWSGGAGVFGPNASALNATYTPTAGEIAARGVTLTLTTNDPVGPCPAVTDQIRITIDPATVVNAGPDQTVCSSSPQVHLQGAVSGTVTSGTWSGGAGAYSPGPGSLSATYTPTPAEIAAGMVVLTLTSAVSAGPCPVNSDQMMVVISPAVSVNAGPDQVVCAAFPQVQLAGSLGSGATSGTWSGGAGTFSPSASTLNAIYLPSAGEVAAGSATLTLTTNDPVGPCPAVGDQMKITFDAPSVTVSDRVVCTGIAPVTLCAGPTGGIAPYTYRWNTGATSACISVSDTASYTVTITDSKGCQAVGAGSFRQRECIGLLAHTSTTCATFMAGTGEPLTGVNYVLRDGVISSISPGVFFYYSKVTAPSSDFTIRIVQTRTNNAFPFCEVQQDQVVLYDSDCNRVVTGTESSPGQAVISVQGATVGKVFIVSVKYSLKTLVGTPMDGGTGVLFGFRTEVNGMVVDWDPDGLQIGAQVALGVDDPPSSDDGLEAYRAVPNPFSGRMRMVYRVGSASERVNVSVYDLAGRRLRTLVAGVQSAGRHSVAWDGRDEQGARLRGGMYFVHVRVGSQARQVRVTFLN